MASVQDRHTYPFSAIVGQERMRLALLLNAVNPAIGGVLIRGEKGTGKSTAVRALARLLPEHEVVAGCHFGCGPDDREGLCLDCRERLAREGHLQAVMRRMRVVELPINSSEDRVVGTIDLEAALKEGSRRFEPGVLAEANRNILYVDEVNLLDDHLIDVLLDAAAMGVNVVEREGVSMAHPARFILVGTMNPEEGELRPQLLDRFGLCVDVEGIRDLEQRVAIVERETCFRSGAPAFITQFEAADRELSDRLREALFAPVRVSRGQARLIASICLEAGVLGHRADVVIERTARALAAYRRHGTPTTDDLYDAAELALAHRATNPIRRQSQEEEEPPTAEGEPDPAESTPGESVSTEVSPQASDQDAGADQEGGPERSEVSQSSTGEDGPAAGAGEGAESGPEADDPFALRRIELPRQRRPRNQGGKRATSQSADRRGRYVRAEAQEKVADLALDATIRAAAPHQVGRGRAPGDRLRLEAGDLREKVRERKVGNLIVFVVDASASMDAEQRMAATKGAILSLLQDAYVRRDRVAVVVFKNRSAEVVMRPTSSVSLARRRLERMSVGGTTPLTHGLLAGYQVIKTELMRDPTVRPLLVLISDGRGNISMFREEPLLEAQQAAALIQAESIETLVIDSARDYGSVTLGSPPARVAPMYQSYAINACADLAARMGAQYYGLYDLSREEIASAVQRQLRR